MKRFLKFAGEALEAIEFLAFVCAAIALVAVGPFVWIYQLFAADRVVVASVIAILWLASATAVGGEVFRKAITIVSFGVFLAWLVTLTWVFHDWLL